MFFLKINNTIKKKKNNKIFKKIDFNVNKNFFPLQGHNVYFFAVKMKNKKIGPMNKLRKA